MIETLPHFKEAEALRKTDPAQALELFQRLWEVTKQFRAARGYAYCLRKAGRVEDAIAICHAALELYPTNKIIRNELAWALYEIKIKPAKENGDLRSILAAAKEIFGLEPDPMAQQKVAIKVIQVAKANGRWNVVLEWTNRFKPDDFSSESFPSYGKKLMSDREIFYNAKSRALYETKGFSESRTFAQAGLAEYPDDIFLARTAALALAEEGQVETAAEELRQLIMNSTLSISKTRNHRFSRHSCKLD